MANINFATTSLFIVNYRSLRIVYCQCILLFGVTLIRTVHVKFVLVSQVSSNSIQEKKKKKNQPEEILALKGFAVYVNLKQQWNESL